jgi:hypothetical protein
MRMNVYHAMYLGLLIFLLLMGLAACIHPLLGGR